MTVMVDAMSSFGAIPLDMEEPSIDVMVSSSNKCIEGVPGFSYVLCRRTLLEASKGICHSIVLDLYEQWTGLEKNGQFRFTPPTHALVAFHQALKEHDAQGGVAGARRPLSRAMPMCWSRACGRWASRRCSTTTEAGRSSRLFSPRATPISISSASTRCSGSAAIAIYPGKLTKRPSFRIGTIGQIDETVMHARAARDPRGAAGNEGHRHAAAGGLRKEFRNEAKPMIQNRKSVSVNGRTYAWPQAPLVVICCDGSEPAYMEIAREQGLMPNLDRMIAKGENLRGLSAMPSFTNPNNLSIVTGRPPAVHGICGNYLIDPETGAEVMMNDPKWLRAPTIFEAFQKAGAKVAVVTAKDKLRLLLGKGLVFDGSAVCFSSEKADKATLAENGIDDAAHADRQWPFPRSIRPNFRNSCSRRASNCSDAAARPHVSVDHRLRAAQICAGRRQGATTSTP